MFPKQDTLSAQPLGAVVRRVRRKNLKIAVEQDVVEAWKSVVDSWFHRLLNLASSNLPDKCWAGICLLGLINIFTRLSGFSDAKKDGASQATRVIQPALKLLTEDSSAFVLVGIE